MNLREKILQAKEALEPLEVPEWGGITVYLQGLTVNDRQKIREQGETVDVAALLCQAVRDETGKRLFTEEDIPALREKNAALLDRILLRWYELNGLTAKAVEEAEKN
jgi:hypothetical protein